MQGDFEGLVRGAEPKAGATRSLLVLSLLLCLVFFFAVGAYGFFAEEERTSGSIPGAVAVLREFLSENESVSVFLGFDTEDESLSTDTDTDAAYEARVKEKARAYIAEKEGGRA